MPFNGSGDFNRIYSWMADAANGLPISSSRMDQDTDDIANGLSNCVTRDGQSPALADLSLGGFKITDLAPGVASTDAATVGQITLFSGSAWITETGVTTFLSTTSFKVQATNATARYEPGRQLIIASTGGVSSVFVVSSAYSAPDTTVTIGYNPSPAMSGTITSVLYSTDYPTVPFSHQGSVVVATQLGSQTVNASFTALKLQLNNEVLDVLTEFDPTTNYRYTAKTYGFYHVDAQAEFQQTSAGTLFLSLYVGKNGSAVGYLSTHNQSNDGVSYGAGGLHYLTLSGVIQLQAGDYLELFLTQTKIGTVAAGALNVHRIHP